MLIGLGGNDWLAGGKGDDQLSAGTGHDTVSGGPDIDLLDGSTGEDSLDGGPGNDVYRGGDRRDEATFARSPKAVKVNLTTRSATGDGSDSPAEIEDVTGSKFADHITGDANDNRLGGGAGFGLDSGNDMLFGEGGPDTLDGGEEPNGSFAFDGCDGGVPVGDDTAANCELVANL